MNSSSINSKPQMPELSKNPSTSLITDRLQRLKAQKNSNLIKSNFVLTERIMNKRNAPNISNLSNFKVKTPKKTIMMKRYNS